jgi:hypothetical protein
MVAGRWYIGATQHSTETAETMSSYRMRRRIDGRRDPSFRRLQNLP